MGIVINRVMHPRKGQKCYTCKKVIKGEYAYVGHWYCKKCVDKETKKRIERFKSNQIDLWVK